MELTQHGLMVFLIVGAVVALEMRDLLSSVIAVGVVGLGLSILFLLLGAPDIAITQVVVEVIVLTVLIRLVQRVGDEEEKQGTGIPTVVAGIAVILAFLGFAIHAFAALPTFGEPLMTVSDWYLGNGPARTGAIAAARAARGDRIVVFGSFQVVGPVMAALRL